MERNTHELTTILEKFIESGWNLIATPSKAWLEGTYNREDLTSALIQADDECGSCGCECDPLYKRALQILDEMK